jgi:prepilin peptidase CpaA
MIMDATLIRSCGLGLLAGFLAAALWRDLASYRIPNAVVCPGTAAALILHAALPEGYGLLSSVPGALGLGASLAGLGIGLAALLPLYLIRAAGAGDAKLMAMAGAFLGASDALGAVFATYLAGMAIALLAMTRAGVAAGVARNLRLIAYGAFARLAAIEGPRFDPRADCAARLPYSSAIALGTAGWCAWRLWP